MTRGRLFAYRLGSTLDHYGLSRLPFRVSTYLNISSHQNKSCFLQVSLTASATGQSAALIFEGSVAPAS